MSVFTAIFADVALAAAQDLFEIVAPSNSRLRIREIRVGQYSDPVASQNMIGIQIIRGHTTSGSGGTSVTPSNLQPWGRASGATVEANNTTVAADGSPEILIADTFNDQAGWVWPGGDDPMLRGGFDDGYIYLNPSQRLVVRITDPDAADNCTANGTIVFEEIGKTGN